MNENETYLEYLRLDLHLGARGNEVEGDREGRGCPGLPVRKNRTTFYMFRWK